MSRLLLTMLSAVAEFERDLIVERTKLGLDRARREGKRLGRPPSPRPPTRRVEALRKRGYTWAEVADELDCSVWSARQAVVKNGGPAGGRKRARRPA